MTVNMEALETVKARAVEHLTDLTGDRDGAVLAVDIILQLSRMTTEQRRDFRRWIRSLSAAYDAVCIHPEQ